LEGVSTLAPGQSAIFLEKGDGTTAAAFTNFWFGATIPPGFQIGTYTAASIGLSSGGDAANVFNGDGDHITGLSFGASTTNVSFDNAAGAGSYLTPLPAISTLSVEGVNGAFVAHDQTGSPCRIASLPPPPSVKVTEVSPSSSGNTTYKADWFELI